MSGGYWLFARRDEDRIKEATKRLNLESIQNRLFHSFSNMKIYIAKKENETFFRFSKDELIEHLTDMNTFSLEYSPRRHAIDNPFAFIMARKRNIDLELAQTLSDIIIERAKRKNLILLEQDQNLSDTYRHKLPEMKNEYKPSQTDEL